MRLRSWTHAPLVASPTPFELIREFVAVVPPSTPIDVRTRSLFAASHLHCQRGGRAISGEECLACDRIVSVLPSPGRRTITVRCLWTDDDRVDRVMTLADRVTCIARDRTVSEAAHAAQVAGVHHLLVGDCTEVLGTICECALEGGEGTVGDRMIPHVWTVPPTATLGQALDAMQMLEVGVLVVAEGDVLRGTVEAGDLRVGAGAPQHVH